MLIFFAIFNLKLICHLSGQEAFFVWSLTQDPSLTWNTVITFSFRIHLLKVLARFFILLVTFKILHGVAPSYLKDLVSVLPDSRYQLRRNNNGILLERPRLRTKKTLGDRALSMAAPFLWNSLPLPIRQETSIDSFKRSVKTYLFKKAFS